ncbi:MAG: FkbM family methyltransferase [Paracoccaceae bacterium]
MLDRVRHNARRFRRQGFYVSPPAQVVRASVGGEPVFFTVANPEDAIQKEHFRGRFYETEELEIIRRHFPPGGRFCDIGANVGNHSLFVGKVLKASRIVLFEPNPQAIEILESNIYLNGLEHVCDRRHLGVGLSDAASEGHALRVRRDNLGGARLLPGEGGDIRVEVGDALLDGQDFDMFKIDVEGMEIGVLRGLSALIRRSRPKIFVEVENANAQAFQELAEEYGYAIVERFQRYRRNVNYLLEPRA